jgi:hypothetical protein
MPGGIPISPIPILAPIGAIVAWLKGDANTPALPSGWVECRGQTINDSESPYNGHAIPNLCPDYIASASVDACNYSGEYFLAGTLNEHPYYSRNTPAPAYLYFNCDRWLLDTAIYPDSTIDDYVSESSDIVNNYTPPDGPSGNVLVAAGTKCLIMRVK